MKKQNWLAYSGKAITLVAVTATEVEGELEAAAAALETRVKLLRIAAQQIDPEAWQAVEPQLRDIVPSWYRQVLARHSLYGVGLEYRDRKNTFVRLFSFAGPEDYKSTLDDGSVYLPLLKYRFVPIGFESDGNLWVLQAPCDADAAVYMLELSGWDGGQPTRRNGLVFAASRLSLLLCSMGISEISYDSGVTSLIWYEERESN